MKAKRDRGKLVDQDVLDRVKPGHANVLALQPWQRELLADDEGRAALSIFQHFLHALDEAAPTEAKRQRFPYTPSMAQAIGQKLRLGTGRNEARRHVRRIRQAGLLGHAGSYRSRFGPHQTRPGFRVQLWRLLVGVWLRPAKAVSPRQARARRITRQNWWRDPLQGNPGARPPPKLLRRTAIGWGRRITYEVWL